MHEGRTQTLVKNLYNQHQMDSCHTPVASRVVCGLGSSSFDGRRGRFSVRDHGKRWIGRLCWWSRGVDVRKHSSEARMCIQSSLSVHTLLANGKVHDCYHTSLLNDIFPTNLEVALASRWCDRSRDNGLRLSVVLKRYRLLNMSWQCRDWKIIDSHMTESWWRLVRWPSAHTRGCCRGRMATLQQRQKHVK